MAVVQNSLIGRTRGSIGGVTFSTQFGLNVAKAKPVSVANPQTDKQLMRRSALTQVTAIGRRLLGVINTTFNSLAVGKSAYNAFSSLALRNAFEYSLPPTAVFQPENLSISKGTIAPTAIDSLALNVPGQLLTVSFPTTTTGVGQSPSDIPVVVVHSPTVDEWFGFVTEDTRADGVTVIDLSLSSSLAGQLDVYLAFVSDNFNSSSDSVYRKTGMA